ncbi:MAG: DNA polymerase III subunit gamma/tau [Mycoplasmoidaceae bacterium]
MNYLSLYRKYRPKTFADVIGQEYIVKILKNSIKNNQVANAYVFAGTKGTGKTSIAKIYANAINCLHNKDGDVCGQCEVCKDFTNNQIIDVVELDGASNNGVDEVRQINDAAMFLPAKLNKKVYIIDEAHMLTTQAWNALLKLVEEPPKHVVFIFATTEMHKIPGTILSRCQCFRFNKILHSDMVKMLTKVCKAENIKCDLDALKIIADIADGSARDALSILEQTATYGDNTINVQDIYKVYGLLSPKEMVDFINLLTTQNSQDIFTKINSYFQSGINFMNFANLLVSILTDKLIYAKTNNYKLLTKTNENLVTSVAIDDIDKLVKLLDIWQETYFKVSTPTDVHVIIDHAIIKSLAVFDGVSNTHVSETKPQHKVQPKVVKQEVVQTKDDDQMFVFSDVEVKTPKKEPKKEKKQEPAPTLNRVKDLTMPSEKDILLSIFSNRSKEAEIQAKDILNKIKSGKLDEKPFSHAQRASQVICASQNGIVLVFDDQMDATLFNKASKKKDFILSCCKIFRNPKFVVGFTKQQINSFKNEMLEAKKNHTPLLDLDVLREILNKGGSIEQIAWNTIYSKLDDKDKK